MKSQAYVTELFLIMQYQLSSFISQIMPLVKVLFIVSSYWYN